MGKQKGLCIMETKKKGIFKYDEVRISNALEKFSDEFEVPGIVGNLIKTALGIAYTSTEPLGQRKFPIRSYQEIADATPYSQYQKLCETVHGESHSLESVRNEQNKWFNDPSVGEVDPLAVFGLKISLWSLHGEAPEGTLSKTCPVCSFEPDFFYLNSDGEFNLVCARCDYDWRYKRTSCPFCGSELPTDISYLVSMNNFARVRECHSCGRKLLGVDARHSNRPFSYILEKLITGHVLGSFEPAEKRS